MKLEYASWIEANVPENPLGMCHETCTKMQVVFPELKIVRGHYYDVLWGERGHWWLIATDGSIVDPTAAQFPSLGRGVYVEWDEGSKEPTGKCLNCGEYCYDHATCCSEDCDRALTSYLNARPNAYD